MSIRMLIVAALMTALASPLPADSGGEVWRQKVDPWVLETGRAGDTEFLVFLADQAELDAAEALTDKLAKGRFVFRALTETAERTQGPLL